MFGSLDNYSSKSARTVDFSISVPDTEILNQFGISTDGTKSFSFDEFGSTCPYNEFVYDIFTSDCALGLVSLDSATRTVEVDYSSVTDDDVGTCTVPIRGIQGSTESEDYTFDITIYHSESTLLESTSSVETISHTVGYAATLMKMTYLECDCTYGATF